MINGKIARALTQITTAKADVFTVPNFVSTAIASGMISKTDAVHNVKVYKTWVFNLLRVTS